MKKFIANFVYELRFARWYWRHTGLIWEWVKQGLDKDTRRILRERNWATCPKRPEEETTP